MRSVVLIHGLLTGMGYEGPCELLALRESQPTSGPVVSYSRCSVIEAPPNLPDGDYLVTFGGYITPAKKEAGLWIPDEIADPVRPKLDAKPAPLAEPPFRIEEAAEILPVLKNRVA